MRVFWVVGLAFLITGCSGVREQVEDLLVVSGVAEPAPQQERPLYCYRTLAEQECHADPLPLRELGRLVEYYGPPPASLSNGGAARP